MTSSSREHDACGAQAHHNLDASHAGLGQRVADVLRLRRCLRAPADDADGLDVGPRLRKLVELVATAADDVPGTQQTRRRAGKRTDAAGR